MSNPVSESLASEHAMPKPSPRVVITALGITQILAWGSSFYLPAVLAQPIAADTGWSLGWVVGGLSVGLLAAGLVAPRVGRTIDAKGGRPGIGSGCRPMVRNHVCHVFTIELSAGQLLELVHFLCACLSG